MMKKYFLFILTIIIFAACSSKPEGYVIGVSQCSEDVWRKNMNDALRIASYQYDNVQLKFVSTKDNSAEQVNQINQLIDENVSLLIVSPNQIQTISSVIKRATDKGIPVVLFDRKIDSDDYTAFIGADNVEIGRMMGQYVAHKLKGKGSIVEITGLLSSSPAVDRHKGFAQAVSKYPGLKVIASVPADWQSKEAYSAMDSLLKKYDKIDCVFAQNDNMALAARKAAHQAGCDNQMLFVGIDALPVKGGGMESVRDGLLDASYFYPTRGDLVMELTMNILQGKHFERENHLQSTLVTKDNAVQMLMMRNEIDSQITHLKELHDKVDSYLAKYQHQRVYLWNAIIIIVLILIISSIVYREMVRRHHKAELESQAKLRFFTDVSHQIRTLLSLVIDPLKQLSDYKSLEGKSREIIDMMKLNANSLSQIVDGFLGDEKDSEESKLSEADRMFVSKLRTIIVANMDNSSFGVEDIGKEVGLSRAQLYRKTKALTGSSVVDLIRQARLQKGHLLLQSSGKSVSEIAYEVGFTSPSYFAKCFKEQYGKTPQEAQL